MPSFPDTAVLIVLALLLFGPKKLPVLARQLGKLMADFRRASSEFRTQMEEELRISEQADRQKQIADLEAAAPQTPAIDAPADAIPEPEHPHLPPPEPSFLSASGQTPELESTPSEPAPTPLPIATSGELSIMPPSTGLPVANTSLTPFLDSIPATQAPETSTHTHAASNGAASTTEIPHQSVGDSYEPAREAESPVHG